MKIRKRVRLNTSFATKAISDRFPHFGATKIGDSGRHGNPHFSVFYTRLATQSGRYPLKDEDARPPAGESRSTGAHPASGQRQQHFPAEGHALEERTIRQAAVAPTAGRMPKAASETDGLPSSRGQTGSALSAPPRIPARRRRNGAPKRSSVTQKHRTSLPADELRIARDIGSAGDRLPVLARHAAERLPPRRRSRIPSSGRHETTDGPGSAQSGNIAIFILRNRLCSVQIAARCGIGEVVSPEEALSGKSTGTPAIAARLPRTSARHRHVSTCRPPEGGDFRSRPHRTGRQFRRFAPGRPSCTALAGGADTSVGERQLPQHNGRSIRLIAEHGLSTTGKRRPRPSPRANESRRSEKRALPHPTRFRSEAAHSRRRLRPPGGSGSVSNRAEKTNRSRPAPYHRRLSRSRPSTHTRPRPVTSNGKQRKQGRPTNLLPPLPENLLFGENTKTVTIEKRLSEIRQTASFRSGSGTTRK